MKESQMPADMDNHNSLAVRRRGATKHSVEDQALDQIAKEKIVSFGSGRTSAEPSDEDASRPVTPVPVTLEPDLKQSKKKKGRNKKHKKTKLDDDSNDDDVAAPVSQHEIPEIFFDDLSETDKSKDGSTSHDVSSSDFSENVSSADTDFWADRGNDDFLRKKRVDDENPREDEEVTEDFWSESKDGSGRMGVKQDCFASQADDTVDTSGSVNNDGSAKDDAVTSTDVWSELDDGSERADVEQDHSTSHANYAREIVNGDGSGNDNSEEMDDNESAKAGTTSDFLSAGTNEELPKSDIADENLNISNVSNHEDVNDFWADHDDDQAFLARKTSLRSSNSHDASVSPEKSQTPDSSPLKSGNSDDDFQNDNPKNVEDEALSEAENGIDSIWTEEDLPPIYEIKKSKSRSLVRQSAEDYDQESEAIENDTVENQDLSQSGQDIKVKSPSPNSEEGDSSNVSGEENDNEESPDSFTNTDDAVTSTEKTITSSEDCSEDVQESTGEDTGHGDAVDKGSLIKKGRTIRDLEAPLRRRSVILPDNRERMEVMPPTPPPLPKSPPPYPRSPPSSARSSLQSEHSVDSRSRVRHVSDTSTDGDVHDDGIMDFLGKENDRAEARLAARRQARVEAREIRMRELERVQKEQDENSDKVLDLHCTTPPHINNTRQTSMSPRDRPTPTPTNSYHSSRRSSEDSMEDGLNLRDIRHELKEVEDKFRKAMIANAQLDNEKAAHAYQVELLKDRLEDLEEAHALLNREYREKCREHESLKRVALKLKEDLTICKMCLDERDRLIMDYGLTIVGGDVDEKGEATPRALVSREAADVLEAVGEGSLDVRLKALSNEKCELADEVRHLKLELEEERNRRRAEERASNGPLPDDIQQTLNDYRFRLQKTEQDTSTLQATVARLESQVIRYKSAAEESEKAEEELKQEKRKLLREHRESIARIEELETSNSHLQRRMDKLKNAKSTLLKEL